MTNYAYPTKKQFWIVVALILGATLFVRTYDITARLFHADEGVNFHFLQEITRKGYYPYSHENYHGPAFFYLTYAMTWLFGDSELGMRSSAIFMGWLTIVSILLLLKTESKRFILLALLFAGFSASLVFKSRYIIHESLFVFSGMLLALGVYLWFKTREPKYHYLSGIGLGLIISTKETFIITLFAIFFAFFAMGDWVRVWQDLKKQWEHIFLGSLLAIVIIILCFTGGLTWAVGLREMLYAVPQWVGRNESDYGHFKPFGYYVYVILGPYLGELVEKFFSISTESWRSKVATEPQHWFIVFSLLLSVLYFPWRVRHWFGKEYALGRFLFVWTMLTLLVYSFVSYKTPWLIISITLPAALLLAWQISQLFGMPKYGKIIGVPTTTVLVALTLYSMWTYNFIIPVGKQNPFSYVHTHPNMLEFIADLKKYREKYGKARVLVGASQYWPLPYYLRDHPEGAGYEVAKEGEKYINMYDVLILNLEVNWSNPNWESKYYRLTEVQEANVYFRKQ